jgi:hypothetical protein
MKSRLGWILLLTALSRTLVLAGALTLFAHSAFVAHLVADLATWREFFEATRVGLRPYVDFPKEYPVGAALVYWVMGQFVRPADLKSIVLVHGIFMIFADLLNATLMYRILRELAPSRAFALTLLFSLNLTAVILSPFRFESVVLIVVILGYLFHIRDHPRWTTFFWSLGWGLKWFPAFFIAARECRAFFVERKRLEWLRSGLVFLGVAAALNLPFAVADYRAHGHFEHFLSPYLFHVARPLYWDTLLGVGELWWGVLSFERYGSLWTTGLVLAALLARPRMALEYKCVLVCVAAILVNRVYSAQFQLWFYPFLLFGLAKESGRGILAFFLGLDLLNVLVYPFSFTLAYAEVQGFRPGAAAELGGLWAIVFSVAIVLRALLLAGLAGFLVARRGGSE